jgi:hypothetical protein
MRLICFLVLTSMLVAIGCILVGTGSGLKAQRNQQLQDAMQKF